jgi:hypothetical protein
MFNPSFLKKECGAHEIKMPSVCPSRCPVLLLNQLVNVYSVQQTGHTTDDNLVAKLHKMEDVQISEVMQNLHQSTWARKVFYVDISPNE